MVDARLLDSAGRRRSPASLPGYHAGRIPRNKGQRYPADPPRTEEIIAVMRCAGADLHGERVRALIVILWRAGLRIQEALSLTELDLDSRRGSVLVRRGKGGRRREIGMDVWGFEHVRPWREARRAMPVGYAELRFAPTASPQPAPIQGPRGPQRNPGPSCHFTRISNTSTSA